MTAAARDLTRRVRALQERRHALTDAKDHLGAHTALDLAVSLIDAADRGTLGEALLHATNPANTPPVHSGLGPQDVAAVVGQAEITVLIDKYGAAAFAYGKSGLAADGKACQRAWRELQAAIDPLCRAVPTYELGGGRTS
jgi:hypothetical protein